MCFFSNYSKQVIDYDSINTFFLEYQRRAPKLQTIILNFGYQKSNFKRLVSGLLALEFLTSKKSKITRSKHLNVLLKIKQGNPVGCKIILKKKIMHQLHAKFMTSVFTKLKPSKNTVSKQGCKSMSITIQNPLIFIELEHHYEVFKDIPKLDITFITNANSTKELFFLLKSIKIFCK